ncbi:hypothetical protein OAB52_02390, partial [Candidatus Thioglobus sp.]|nr:hypothetical protein [Candidatus Thioglobus sp.]
MINLKHGYHALILFFLVSLVLYYFFKIDSSSFLMPFDDSYVRADGRMTIAYVKFLASGDWSSLIVPKTSHLSAPFHFEMY